MKSSFFFSTLGLLFIYLFIVFPSSDGSMVEMCLSPMVPYRWENFHEEMQAELCWHYYHWHSRVLQSPYIGFFGNNEDFSPNSRTINSTDNINGYLNHGIATFLSMPLHSWELISYFPCTVRELVCMAVCRECLSTYLHMFTTDIASRELHTYSSVWWCERRWQDAFHWFLLVSD